MTSTKHSLWVEKYRPQTIKDYVFHDDVHQRFFEQIIEQQTLTGHLLLSGAAGTGKTSIVGVLLNELNIERSDVLVINASDENSVDVMRDKIKSFISTFAVGEFKVVQLEECDYLSGSSQAVLRKMMEDNADSARFILTCNYESKIIPAVKSRCQTFRFKAPNVNSVTELAAKILIEEHVNFDINLLDKYVSSGYPDIRKIINMLQQNTINGELNSSLTNREAGDYKFELLDLIERAKWLEVRKFACENVPTEEWENVYRFLYDNLHKCPTYEDLDKWEAGIVIIADHLQKHSMVADPEINAAAMFIKLKQEQ